MPDLLGAVILPAGQYRIETWGPLRTGMALEVNRDCIVLAHIAEAREVPFIRPNGGGLGMPTRGRQMSFTLLIAVPADTEGT